MGKVFSDFFGFFRISPFKSRGGDDGRCLNSRNQHCGGRGGGVHHIWRVGNKANQD